MTQRRIQDIVIAGKPGERTRPLPRIKKKGTIHDNVSQNTKREEEQPKQNRSIKQVRNSSTRAKPPRTVIPDPVVTVSSDPRSDRGTRFLWWIAFIAIIILVYSVSTLLTHATITYTPKSATAQLSTSFRAYQQATGEQLNFDTLVIEESASEAVTASGTETVSQKASGTIVVYNNHSTQSQRLIEETRFETPDGLIYKLGKGAGIVVPGKKSGAPGSVETVVYAEKPGAEYNSSPADFTIPGFKGSEKYSNFYARSKSPITGGVIEERPIIKDDQLEAVRTRLNDLLTDRLRSSILTHVRPEFVVFPDTAVITTDPTKETYAQRSDGTTIFEQTVKMTVPLFPREVLSSYIVTTVLDYEGEEPIHVTNLDELTFSFIDDVDNIATADQVIFSLEGVPRFEWAVDEQQLVYDILDAPKKSFQAIASRHSGIQSAELIIKPFWRNLVPKSARRVDVVRGDGVN